MSKKKKENQGCVKEEERKSRLCQRRKKENQGCAKERQKENQGCVKDRQRQKEKNEKGKLATKTSTRQPNKKTNP